MDLYVYGMSCARSSARKAGHFLLLLLFPIRGPALADEVARVVGWLGGVELVGVVEYFGHLSFR